MATLTDSGHSVLLSGAAGSVGLHNAEDVGDFITNISPTETPFISGIGRTTATAVTHEWLIHSLAAAAAGNVVIEGADAVLTTPTTVTRTSNITQINAKSVAISGTQDKVKKYGMGKEMAYRVLLHTKEMKRDMETAALVNAAATAGSTSAARQINGALGWITSNTSGTAGSTALTVALINSRLNEAWTAGGNPDTIICGGVNKQLISTFTTGVTKNLDAMDRKLTTAVDVYESDFGVLKIVPDRFCDTQTVYMLEMDLWKFAELRPMKVEPLPKSGDYTKAQIICEWTLESRQEAGNAYQRTV